MSLDGSPTLGTSTFELQPTAATHPRMGLVFIMIAFPVKMPPPLPPAGGANKCICFLIISESFPWKDILPATVDRPTTRCSPSNRNHHPFALTNPHTLCGVRDKSGGSPKIPCEDEEFFLKSLKSELPIPFKVTNKRHSAAKLQNDA